MPLYTFLLACVLLVIPGGITWARPHWALRVVLVGFLLALGLAAWVIGLGLLSGEPSLIVFAAVAYGAMFAVWCLGAFAGAWLRGRSDRRSGLLEGQ
jgi:hypothetical protein